MKILCVCLGGVVRSTTLAFLLKQRYGQDALAAGVGWNGTDTMHTLCQWAERVIVLDRVLTPFLPAVFDDKVVVWDIGADVWDHPNHPDLIARLNAVLDEQFSELGAKARDSEEVLKERLTLPLGAAA